MGLELKDRGTISEYLDINFYYEKNGSITMSQPHLISQVLQAVIQKPNVHLSPTPTISSRLLRREEGNPPYDG